MTAFWLDVSKALIGTFVGATLAFGLGLVAQHIQRKLAWRAAGNAAMTTLRGQFDGFLNFRRGFTTALKERHDEVPAFPLWLIAHPLYFTFNESLRIDLAALMFLGEYGHADLIGMLGLAETRYFDLVAIAKQYNDACYEKQKRLSDRFGPEDSATGADIKKMVGTELIKRIESSIGAILLRLSNDQDQYIAAGAKLDRAMTGIFRKHTLRMESPKPDWANNRVSQDLLKLLPPEVGSGPR